MAQVTVFTTKNWTAGTYTSGTAQYGGSPVTVNYQFQGTTAKWGTTPNPAITIEVQVQQNVNDGEGWTLLFGFTVNPGQLDKHGNLPSGSFIVNDNIGARNCQVVMIVTGGSADFGLTGTDSPYTG